MAREYFIVEKGETLEEAIQAHDKQKGFPTISSAREEALIFSEDGWKIVDDLGRTVDIDESSCKIPAS